MDLKKLSAYERVVVFNVQNEDLQTREVGWNKYITIKVSKVGDCSRGRPEGSLFNSYYTEV